MTPSGLFARLCHAFPVTISNTCTYDLLMTSVTSPHKIQKKFLLVGRTALRPVYTGDRYTLPVHTGRRAEKHCMSSFFCSLRAVCTGRIYGRPVHTTRIYGPYIRPVYTGAKNAPVYTARIRPVHTGRIYGPYIRVVCTGLESYSVSQA